MIRNQTVKLESHLVVVVRVMTYRPVDAAHLQASFLLLSHLEMKITDSNAQA